MSKVGELIKEALMESFLSEAKKETSNANTSSKGPKTTDAKFNPTEFSSDHAHRIHGHMFNDMPHTQEEAERRERVRSLREPQSTETIHHSDGSIHYISTHHAGVSGLHRQDRRDPNVSHIRVTTIPVTQSHYRNEVDRDSYDSSIGEHNHATGEFHITHHPDMPEKHKKEIEAALKAHLAKKTELINKEKANPEKLKNYWKFMGKTIPYRGNIPKEFPAPSKKRK